MVNKQYRLTKAGIQELQDELDKLIAERTAMADKIKTAREFGDLAENSEYQLARQDQDKNEARISELKHILANATEIKKPVGDSKVQLGSSVKLVSEDGKTKEFQVVGTVEADPLEGKISDESPIGRALLGKKVGETVDIKTPADTTTYHIADIS